MPSKLERDRFPGTLAPASAPTRRTFMSRAQAAMSGLCQRLYLLRLQPDPLGWVTVPPDATNQGFSGPLIRFNSASIVPGGTPPGPGAGNPVSPADQKNGVDYQIIFEAEPVSGPSPSGPTLSNSLDRIRINNWLEVAQFNLEQFSTPGTGSCTPITD